tara:strand:- start:2546 stop:2782 length:237 start_codon:yes stop_codon:yes gene_type:complete
MSRKELIEIGNQIVNWSGSEEELLELMTFFDRNVPHPNGSNLFSYPENFNARKDDLSKYNPTVEEVVDKALSYKPIQL